MATKTGAQLLKADEKEFDASIQDMSLKGLLETITVLQKEMGREQEAFNSLSTELARLKKNSSQYRFVGKDLARSQTRLTQLMNRSMKCFSQQGTQQAKAAAVARKNSFNESQRSDVKSRKSEDLEVKPVKKPTEPVRKAEKSVKSSPAKPPPEEPEGQTVSSSYSFSEAMSKFGGKPQNGVASKKPNIVVSSLNNSVSQNSNSAEAANRLSGDVKGKVDKSAGKKEDKVGAKPSVVSAGSNKDINEKKSSPRSVTSSVSVGPIGSQKSQFISKSMDSVMDNKMSEPAKAEQEVVKSSNTGKPRSVLVMNADKQVIDLDSFSDRRNMLAELKAGRTELKPTPSKVKEQTNGENAIADNKNNQSAEQKPLKSILKSNVLGDIKQGKKPSEIKDTSTSLNKTNDKSALAGDIKQESVQSTRSEVKFANVELKKVQAPATDKVSFKVDQDAGKNKPSKEDTNSGLPSSSEVTVKESIEVEEADKDDDEVSESDDGSEASEGDSNYVSEFSFPPTKSVFQPAAAKPKVSEGAKPKTAAPKPPQLLEKLPISNHGSQAVSSNHGNQAASSNHSNKTASSNHGNKAASSSHGSQAANSNHGNQTSSSTHDNQAASSIHDNQAASSNHGNQEASSNHGNQVTSSNHGNKVAAAGQKAEEEGEDELVKQTRVNFIDWDPARLLAELYKVNLQPENVEDISHQFIGMEGLMEKLPMNKKKATLLKTWKRRFFQAKDGWLHYYETSNRDKPSDSLQLMGGGVEELGQRVLGVDDGRGKYLMVRVPTENEYGQWKVALESQTADNVKATYIRPSPASPPHPKKKIIVIDIGSCGIRAGILTEKPTLPQVFMPSVVAVHKQTGEIVVGADALRPTVRKTSTVHYPIRPTNKVDKGVVLPFNIDMQMMTAIFRKVFTDLKVKFSNYLVMLSTPQNLGDQLKGSLMRMLVEDIGVRGVCMVHQCLLALYSYNAMSGIIVDIGERLDILPIYDGLLIESGMSRQAYGGEKVLDSLHISLLENRYRFNTPVEKLLVRYLMEKGCHVAEDYKAAKASCDKDSSKHRVTIDLQDYFLPDGGHTSVSLDHGFFKAPEGFFNTDLWEMDYKNLQKQIFAAIQQCPMDARKQMYRSVYLSGGVTMIPGFADRLQTELVKLAPPAAQVEVHASPQRYHAAYLGACSVAGMDVFEMSCVSADEWKKMGIKACKKWGM